MFLTGEEKEMYSAGFNKLALLALAGWSLEKVHMPLQKINGKKKSGMLLLKLGM